MVIYILKSNAIIGAFRNEDTAIQTAYKIYKEQEENIVSFEKFKEDRLYEHYIIQTQLYD